MQNDHGARPQAKSHGDQSTALRSILVCVQRQRKQQQDEQDAEKRKLRGQKVGVNLPGNSRSGVKRNRKNERASFQFEYEEILELVFTDKGDMTARNNDEWPELGQQASSTTTSTSATSSMSSSSPTASPDKPQQSPRTTKTTTKIADTSILAPSYVPTAFRNILTQPVGTYLPIFKSSPTAQNGVEPFLAMCQKIFFTVVAPVPTCLCFHSRQQLQLHPEPSTQRIHVLPWTMVPQMNIMEPNYVNSRNALLRKNPNFEKVFPKSVYEATQYVGRDGYLRFYEGLIREEFEEIMILYDRYTQYYTEVKPVASFENYDDIKQYGERSQSTTATTTSILQDLSQPYSPRSGQQPMHGMSQPPHRQLPVCRQLRTFQIHQQYGSGPGQRKQTIHRACIEIGGIADARPALQTGDHVLLRCPMSRAKAGEIQTQVESIIRANGTTRRKDQVIVTWEDNVMLDSGIHKVDFHSYSFSVRFLPSITRSQRCLTALKWLKSIKPRIAKSLLFPSTLDEVNTTATTNGDSGKDPFSFFVDVTDPNNVLNEQQSRFCKLVQRRTNVPSYDAVRPPLVLTGPAGTGKTKALLMSIITALSDNPNNRILVCTPSNIAADVIARRLMKHVPANDIFRLCDPTRPVSTAPVDILPLMRQSVDGGDFTLPATAEEFIKFRVIVCTCVDAHILFLCGMTNSSLRSRRQCMQMFITQGLLANSPGVSMKGSDDNGGSSFLDGADRPHFSHLFIDEACQATEPESLIPFSVVVDDEPNFPKVEIALTGDPRQLHPEVYSPWARPTLQVSLLERLLQQGDKNHGRDVSHMLGPVTKDSWVTMDELIQYSLQTTTSQEEEEDNLSVFLTLSYRGHPSFLLVPSKLFYHDKLRSVKNMIAVDENDKWCHIVRQLESLSTPCYKHNSKVMDWPIHCRGVIGRDTSVSVCESWGSNSWSNPEEARVIADIVLYMVRQLQVPTQQIGVMAAFRAQVVVIRSKLREMNLGAVNVGMVEDYQSVERQIILLSLTRSNPSFIPSDLRSNSGLYQQPKRMNVALTRASNMLVVVGNPKTMEQDPYWKEWLQFCIRNGLYYQSSNPTVENGINKKAEEGVNEQINQITLNE